MMKRLKKWWRQHKLGRRLRKMEKCLNIRLRDDQRALVLTPTTPNKLAEWPRRSGKTLCACLHLLLHAPVNAVYSSGEALDFLPDPDAGKSFQIARWTYRELYATYRKIRMAGIETCVLLPPMPGVPDGFVGHGRYAERRRGR